MGELVLIIGPNSPVAADYATHRCRDGDESVAILATLGEDRAPQANAHFYVPGDFSATKFLTVHSESRLKAIVLFLETKSALQEDALIDSIVQIASEKKPDCVCLVSSFLVHFGDTAMAAREETLITRFKSSCRRLVVLRPSFVLSTNSRTTTWLRRLSALRTLFPSRFKGCCIEPEEFFAAVNSATSLPHRGLARTFTLLGPNRPWNDRLRAFERGGVLEQLLSSLCILLSWLLVGRLAGLVFNVISRYKPLWKSFDFDTLRPKSNRELLALYNPYNYQHVKIVGYNNGVVDFGQSHPERTIVSTIHCDRIARVSDSQATFDAGVTLRKAIDFLKQTGKEFYVIPNYSYVSLGTAFFIPIHGSASEFCTIGATIEKVLLYHPADDRFMIGRRDEPPFRHQLYNLGSEVLLLRLGLRVKAKSRYYVTQETIENATSDQVANVFDDRRPSNVEVRKSRASSRSVDVYKYYTDDSTKDSEALEFPKDKVGRLWDRLESNRVSAMVFHGLMRRFGYHTELFIPPEEFAMFWNTHGSMPISKIQLRYIKCDGLPNSPFRDNDCIAADLFMLKKHKQVFERYLKEICPVVKMNPGKHSM